MPSIEAMRSLAKTLDSQLAGLTGDEPYLIRGAEVASIFRNLLGGTAQFFIAPETVFDGTMPIHVVDKDELVWTILFFIDCGELDYCEIASVADRCGSFELWWKFQEEPIGLLTETERRALASLIHVSFQDFIEIADLHLSDND
jgi:hypothetical protein